MSNTPVVLVVDDEEDILESCACLLEDGDDQGNRYTVLRAQDGQEALDMASRQVPDAILLDLMMPRMNGWEFVEQARKRPELAHIPIVLISADRAIARWAQELGAVGYLAKPFDVSGLLGQVAQAVRARRAGPGKSST